MITPPVKIAFADFWSGFDTRDNVFQSILEQRLGAVIENDPDKADILIYSVFGQEHHSFPGIRIFFTGESLLPWWDECDYSITFMRDGMPYPECHLRLPVWMNRHYFRTNHRIEEYSRDREAILSRHTRFCNFVYSNGHASERLHFLDLLSRYKPIDCGGRLRNNTGSLADHKIEFCSRYKFTIAFENYPSAGYTTEKLIDALAAISLPIYWGDPDAHLEVNPARMINAADFPSPEALVEQIIRLDQDDDLYMQHMTPPIFTDGQPDYEDHLNRLEHFLAGILKEGRITRHNRPRQKECGPQWFNHQLMPRHNDGKQWQPLNK